VILNALKKYGMIMRQRFESVSQRRPRRSLDNTDLHALGQVSASNFEVLQMTPLYTQTPVPSGPPADHVLHSDREFHFTGAQVTLSWV